MPTRPKQQGGKTVFLASPADGSRGDGTRSRPPARDSLGALVCAEDLVGGLGVERLVEPGGELAQVGAGRDEVALSLGELKAARGDDLDQVLDLGLHRALLQAFLPALLKALLPALLPALLEESVDEGAAVF